MTPLSDALVEQVLARRGHRRDQLVQILREVQVHTHWLPRPLLARIAADLGLSAAVVEGVAGFYRFFHLRPVGRYHLLFSDNVIDRQAGSRLLAQDLCRRLWIEPGKVSEDGLVSVGFCSDIGLGDQGPALLLNQHQVLTRLDSQRVFEIADLVRAQVPPAEWPTQWQHVDDQVRRADLLLGAGPAQGEAIRAALARGAEQTLAELRSAGLRGRGGAGFPTAQKWSLCRQADVPEGGTRVVICNADEGEPGTFKDRVLLARHFDAVIEGMTVAAFVLGARQGFVYLRGEYRYLLNGLEATLATRRAAGLLGPHVAGRAGFGFDVAIHLGAGAYVCGEESALIESLEGKRGTPRIRPPFPVERGYLGQPTVVNNVETWLAAAHIGRHGGAAWAATGVPGSSGTKVHSISGDCTRPGLYEYPFGVTLRQMLADCGAVDTQAVQVGGPSGLTLAAHEFDRRIAFDDVPTAGALMVFDARRDMFEVARGFAQFFAHESCGFCTPCRVGTELIVRRMDKLAAGHGSVFDEAELHELDRLLHGSTHCGLGATAANPLRHTIERFRPAYERRLQAPRFAPAFDLDAELASARRVTGRDDALAHLPGSEP